MRATVENHGTIMLIQPLDSAATSWFEEHLNPEKLMHGTAYVVEPRYLPPILEGFVEAGGEVR